jgi:glycosyltransferase involved in cell wall biosynthesis
MIAEPAGRERPLRVGVIAGFPPDAYGEAHYAGQVFSTMASEHVDAVEIHVFAHERADRPAVERVEPNLVVERVTRPGASRLSRTLATLALVRRIHRAGIDVVHVQGAHTALYGGFFGEPVSLVVRLLRRIGIPVVYTIHSTWTLGELDNSWSARGLPARAARTLSRYFAAQLRFLIRSCDAVNVLISGMSRRVVDEFGAEFGIDPETLLTETHPCDPDPISAERCAAAKQQLGLPPGRLVLAAGFVRADKGFDVLVRAAGPLLREFQDVTVAVVGEPPRATDRIYAATLDDIRSGTANRERLVLRWGLMTDQTLDLWLTAADVIVAPYRRSIGASGPIHHALGRGKAVVATAIGYNRGLEGLCKLVPPGDVDAIGTALAELLTADHEIEALRSRALNYAAKHSWSRLAQRYLGQYRELLRSKAMS